jgi:hypothetical protein
MIRLISEVQVRHTKNHKNHYKKQFIFNLSERIFLPALHAGQRFSCIVHGEHLPKQVEVLEIFKSICAPGGGK